MTDARQAEARAAEREPDGRLLSAGLWRRGEAYVPAVVLGVRAERLPGRGDGSDLVGLFLFSRAVASDDPVGSSRTPSLRIAPLGITRGVWGLLAEGSF